MFRSLKVRELQRRLRRLGCRPIRTAGSHQVWRTPSGGHVTIVIHHLNADVTRTVLRSVRRVLRRKGVL